MAPQDQDALDSKLFLLIQTERYDEALDLIKEMPGTSAEYHAFEKAYLLYRLHKEAEASEVIESARQSGNVDERALTHLEAQIVRDPIPAPELATGKVLSPYRNTARPTTMPLARYMTGYWIPALRWVTLTPDPRTY